MYWRIFDAYNSKEIRDSRDAFFVIEDRLELGHPSGRTKRFEDDNELKELSCKYWKTFYEGEGCDRERDRQARARVRFYAQTGVLLKARLVDRDLLFGLIGPPLDVDMRLLDIILRANRDKHGFPEMYQEVEYAYDKYNKWRKDKHKRAPRRANERNFTDT